MLVQERSGYVESAVTHIRQIGSIQAGGVGGYRTRDLPGGIYSAQR